MLYRCGSRPEANPNITEGGPRRTRTEPKATLSEPEQNRSRPEANANRTEADPKRTRTEQMAARSEWSGPHFPMVGTSLSRLGPRVCANKFAHTSIFEKTTPGTGACLDMSKFPNP